jgi:hypothetical protein
MMFFTGLCLLTALYAQDPVSTSAYRRVQELTTEKDRLTVALVDTQEMSTPVIHITPGEQNQIFHFHGHDSMGL